MENKKRYITVKQLEENLDYYLENAQEGGFYIVDNGKVISWLIDPQEYAKTTGKQI